MKKSLISISISCLVLLLLPTSAQASVTWKNTSNTPSLLQLRGTCDSSQVSIYITDKMTNSLRYSSGAPCVEGKFSHTDNLATWNLKNGTYNITVNEGQEKQADTDGQELILKDTPQKSYEGSNTSESPTFLNTLGVYTDQLIQLTETSNVLEQSLEATPFPEVIKVGIRGVIEMSSSQIMTLTRLLRVINDYVGVEHADKLSEVEVLPTPTQIQSTVASPSATILPTIDNNSQE